MTTQIPQVLPYNLPKGTVPLATQVAGHTDIVYMLKSEHDGSVLKPLGKPVCGAREISFYESLKNATDPNLIALKKLVPEYRGTMKIPINGREIDFIKLNDLTHKMQEPCIMDIKVGKRTWDPLATPEKIAVEKEKYLATKQSLGLCIPGFQVYNLKTGKLRRFGKDYGKKLNEKTFKDALRIFLNFDSGLCHSLISQFLAQLYEVQKWTRSQTTLKLYSSSLLLVYDAKKLRSTLGNTKKNFNNSNGSISLDIEENPSEMNIKPSQQINWAVDSFSPYNKIYKSDKNHINYDQEIRTNHKDEDNVFTLNKTIDAADKFWAFIKMIDFAHAFPSDDKSIDTNYLFGIENLVNIFQEFLKECE